MNLEEATINELIKYVNRKNLFEMANIRTKITGIKPMLYATFDGEHRDDIPHWARVKVELSKKKNKKIDFHFVTLEPVEAYNKHGEYTNLNQTDKKLVDEAVEYLKKHKDVFLAHWKGLIFDDQLYDILLGKISLQEAIDENK